MTLVLPDVNVVLAAFRADHVHNAAARSFLDAARAGDEPLGLSIIVLGSVVRLATNPRVFARPDTTDGVLDYLDVLSTNRRTSSVRASATGHDSPRCAEICSCAATWSPTVTLRRWRSSTMPS